MTKKKSFEILSTRFCRGQVKNILYLNKRESRAVFMLLDSMLVFSASDTSDPDLKTYISLRDSLAL